MRHFYIYILASERNGTLYIGVTNDVSRRVAKHKTRGAEGFTKKYYVDKLVYVEVHPSAESAITREKQLKKWRREWKIKLIESMNPYWDDLYHEED